MSHVHSSATITEQTSGKRLLWPLDGPAVEAINSLLLLWFKVETKSGQVQ